MMAFQLIATEGPLAGQTILVLEPTETFRFTDLPPEIRNMVYGYLIDVPGDVQICSHKPIGKERRSVPSTSIPGLYRSRRRRSLNWAGQDPESEGHFLRAYGLLRVSKQLQSETGSLFYGNTTFAFHNWCDLDLYLDSIGSMRRFIRRIKVPNNPRGSSKSRTVMKKLKDATGLEALFVRHDNLCPSVYRWRGWMGVVGLINTFKPLLKAVQSSHRLNAGAAAADVLDVVQIEAQSGEKALCSHCRDDSGQSCYLCRMGRDHSKDCTGSRNCKVSCKEHEAHCIEFGDEVRAALAKALGIQE